MSFLAPLFLLGAAAAAIPIVLHLLKREPEARVKFAPIRLLRRGPVEQTARRRLRELLLLALRVTALLLLALAFARPYFEAATALDSVGVTVVALDTSLSMSAPGRFEHARALAKAAIDGAPARDLVSVITFAGGSSLAAAPTFDRSLARAAVDAATPGNGPTRYRAALAHASSLLEDGPGTIVIVSDLQEAGWDAGDRAAVPGSARIDVVDVGALPPNLAVTSTRLAGDRIVAVVRSVSPEGGRAREARVRLTVDGKPAGEASTSIAANGSAEVQFPSAPGLAAVVSVEDPDGVRADNDRHLVIGADSRAAILVVTSGGSLAREAFYVQHALAAEGAAGATYRVLAAGGAELSSWDRARIDSHAAVLLLSTRGLERPGRDLLARYLQQGGGMLVAAGPNVDGEVAAGVVGGGMTLGDPPKPLSAPAVGSRAFTPVDPRHPLFNAFGAGAAALALPRFERIAAVRGDDCEVVAQFTTGEAALLDCARDRGRALVLASDLDGQWNDFPRHATFVPFVHEAVRYLAGPRPRAAEYLIGDAPPELPSVPGIVTLEGASGGVGRRIALNVDPAEADPARLTPETFQAAVARMQTSAQAPRRAADSQREDRQRLWQYILGAMLVALLVESVVAARTG